MPDEENDLETMSATGSPHLPFFLLAIFSYFILHAKLTLRKLLRDGVECVGISPVRRYPPELNCKNEWYCPSSSVFKPHTFLQLGNFLQEMTFIRTNDFIRDT